MSQRRTEPLLRTMLAVFRHSAVVPAQALSVGRGDNPCRVRLLSVRATRLKVVPRRYGMMCGSSRTAAALSLVSLRSSVRRGGAAPGWSVSISGVYDLGATVWEKHRPDRSACAFVIDATTPTRHLSIILLIRRGGTVQPSTLAHHR